ncbi:MAG: hypothetical protein SAL07_01870 [Oscillatoria sp. PMC 1051.18]|nr:hypothetical protein [Oscillatoria sp. PMC 1051.18]
MWYNKQKNGRDGKFSLKNSSKNEVMSRIDLIDESGTLVKKMLKTELG